MQQLTDEDLLLTGSNPEEKERIVPPDMPSVRQARPDFAYFMSDELRFVKITVSYRTKVSTGYE